MSMPRKISCITRIRYREEPEKGERGAVLRGPLDWEDCEAQFRFESGGKNEKWIDIIFYQNQFYECIKSHEKTASNYPGSPVDKANGYWRLNSKFSLIATRIFLASYALVKNLGVEVLEMKDEKGNIVFQAKEGKVTCNTGIFRNIIIGDGARIAGFSVSGTSLSNRDENGKYTNDACVIFRNDEHKMFAGIGGNVMPMSSGQRAAARFENEDNSDQWGLGRNIAAIFTAKNAGVNHAFIGCGNGNLNGWIGGYKYSKCTCKQENMIISGSNISPRENNEWIVHSVVANAGVELPKLAEVQRALGIGPNESFAIKYTILADVDAVPFWVYGRNNRAASNASHPWNTSQLPVIIHWNNDWWDRVDMAAGDSYTFLLVYDPSKSGSKGGYDIKYTARIINHQN